MAKNALDPRGEMRATPRKNALAGYAADAIRTVDNFARNPLGYSNPPAEIVSDFLSVPAIYRTLDRLAYGEPLTNAGKSNVPLMPVDIVDALIALAPVAKVSKVTGATTKQLKAAQLNAAKPVTAGGLGLSAENTAAQRAAAMGYQGGFYRGGEAPVGGLPTGPWYTTIKDEAADYAARAPEAVRDVREYALPTRDVLAFNRSYPQAMATDLASIIEKDGHAKAANELRKYYQPGDRISGMEAYKFLQRFIGEQAPEHYLQRLGFKQVDGVNSPNYRQVLDQTQIRDATRAAFDPARRGERNIFAGVAGGGVALPFMLDQQGEDR